ncbi:MAG TPA: metallophosphoesterase [Candidatus Binatia bacterium]|nr:metallophosphoesterase [Candidatus Binatia bacterium]
MLLVVFLLCGGAVPAGAEGDPVLVGAGDIADCDTPGAAATAALLDDIPGTVFTAGDNVYPDGTTDEFRACYAPTWGRHLARTRPSPGNHEYHSAGARPYYAYFGAGAGEPGRGYYSYDLGGWHIVALNSNLREDAEAAQEQWLREDLAAHKVPCTLAYWHHPLFSSGSGHGGDPRLRPLWQILAEFAADVVINGHDHDYERFAPQTPDGRADAAHGIREFVVGTGGAVLGIFGLPHANSEVRKSGTWGVLKLTLHPTGYDWEFIPAAGGTFHDAGSAACVP